MSLASNRSMSLSDQVMEVPFGQPLKSIESDEPFEEASDVEVEKIQFEQEPDAEDELLLPLAAAVLKSVSMENSGQGQRRSSVGHS